MVVGEFERRADVDYLVEIGQAIEGNKQVFQGAARESARMGRSGLSHAENWVAICPGARPDQRSDMDISTAPIQIPSAHFWLLIVSSHTSG
jgi:hypothetical protein